MAGPSGRGQTARMIVPGGCPPERGLSIQGTAVGVPLCFWWWWFSRKVVSNSCDPMDYSLPGSSVHGILFFFCNTIRHLMLHAACGPARLLPTL